MSFLRQVQIILWGVTPKNILESYFLSASKGDSEAISNDFVGNWSRNDRIKRLQKTMNIS